ncbi:MAG: peptide chain release factor 1 [candidate division Zixibacteria bacterium RBG_16_50_21]|nr:MAG: peptide chain release factor 1 [candidate division Zixibacteria bacterium RBG_16_50_21]
MLELVKKVRERYQELSLLLADPKILTDGSRYKTVSKEFNDLSGIMEVASQYEKVLQGIAEDEKIKRESRDRDLIEMAKQELEELEAKKENLVQRLKILLLPKDPNEGKNVIVEIRAGTGGEEAALFAADLFRMYTRYAEGKDWELELLNSNPTGIGGFKEIIFSLDGKDCYGLMKYEAGIHRVQRVPATEASGRIHTSAVSVAVLPEAGEVDIQIKPEEIRIDVFRSSGPGGQSVNTTDSAVRITHLPSGLVVSCQDEKSQIKNRNKALKVLRSRLLDKAQKEQQEKITQERRSMVGTGDRSEKIRTYNFPQNRVTDHRIGLTIHQLQEVLDGKLDQFSQALRQKEQAEKLAGLQMEKVS